jgi:hypothetical protein
MIEKKRCMLVILSVLAIFLFSAVVLGEVQEFSGELLSGESLDIDEFTFRVTMNKYANAIFVDAGDMFQTIALYDCEKMESFRICFDNTTYDEEDNELYAVVRINRTKPDVSISKTINETELYVGQEAEVTITITNTGDTAPQIIMTDDYPASIEIYDMEGGCSMHENQVYWQGHLDEDREKECTFIIKGTEELHQSFVAHLKYWDGFKWIDEYSSTLTLDFETLLTVYSSIVREDYEVDGTTFDFDDEIPIVYIGEVLRLLVNITNENPDDVYVNLFEINLPPDLEYKSIGHLRFNYVNAEGNRSSIIWSSDRITKVRSNVLRWSGKISEENSKLFIVKLQATRTGNQNLLIHSEYEYDDLVLEDTQHESFDVWDPGIAIRMTIEDQDKRFSAPERLDEEDDTIEVEALHPYNLNVYMQNKNKYAILEDVDINVYTELAGFKRVFYPMIEEEGQKIPYRIVLIPPYVTASKEFKVNVSAAYKNEFDERHYNSTEFKITVKPSKDLTIDFDSSEGTVLEGGEETEIVITVDNDRLVDLKDVSVSDKIPADFHVEGVHAKKVKLNKETETEIYTYRLIPPIVHEKTRYDIITTVSFFDPDLRQTLEFSEVNTITVEPLKPDVTIDVTLDEPDDVYPGTLIPVEYTVQNDEEKEIARQLTVYFPIQEEFDLIGPKTFFIDKLDPGEEVVIKNLVKVRPKIVGKNVELNKTTVEYYDDYGNLFNENSSEEKIEVERANINGPAVFIRTLVPDVLNKSAEGMVKLEIKNNGSGAADMTVEQGDLIWNTTVDAYSTTIIEYPVKYDFEGNYTLPDPIAKMSFQGIEAYTKGRGAEVRVRLLLPEPEVVEEEVAEVEAEEVPEPEKEEMSFEEYEAIGNIQRRKQIVRYSLMGLVAIVALLVIATYIGYQKRKGPSVPFLETGKP